MYNLLGGWVGSWFKVELEWESCWVWKAAALLTSWTIIMTHFRLLPFAPSATELENLSWHWQWTTKPQQRLNLNTQNGILDIDFDLIAFAGWWIVLISVVLSMARKLQQVFFGSATTDQLIPWFINWMAKQWLCNYIGNHHRLDWQLSHAMLVLLSQELPQLTR